MNNTILLNSLTNDNLIGFDITSHQWYETKISEDNLSQGYSDFYTLKNKTQKLVFIASIGKKLYFYYEDFYDISDSSLIAEIKRGFFYNHFTLKKFDNIVVDVIYKSVEIDSDIFMDFVDWLKISPITEKQKRIERSIRFYNEHDKQKRYLIGKERL